jgi:hypothetical protein
LRDINGAADRDWRAAAWLLERRHPETYGRHARQETSGEMTVRFEYVNDWRAPRSNASDELDERQGRQWADRQM